jgi:hypothetical protein
MQVAWTLRWLKPCRWETREKTGRIGTCPCHLFDRNLKSATRLLSSPIRLVVRLGTFVSSRPAAVLVSLRRSRTFCETCNRVGVSCDGTLFMCLGKDDRVDLRQAVRATSSDVLLNEAIDSAMRRKPVGHDFVIARRGQSPALVRHMSVTGG